MPVCPRGKIFLYTAVQIELQINLNISREYPDVSFIAAWRDGYSITDQGDVSLIAAWSNRDYIAPQFWVPLV